MTKGLGPSKWGLEARKWGLQCEMLASKNDAEQCAAALATELVKEQRLRQEAERRLAEALAEIDRLEKLRG